MSKSKLLDYLNHLDKNAEAREAFAKTPHDAMTDFGLNEEEKTALLSGNKATMAALVGVSASLLPTPQVPHQDFQPD
jgi:hypothetical protein